jgi:RNA polymerase sigma-70 factor (ECF subfamily)
VSNVAHLPARGGAPSDAALVVAARAGEVWAREALFRRHAVAANRLALRLLGRDHEVEDVVQDAYVIVLGGLDRLQDPQAFGSFLAGVIVRRVRRVIWRRRLARRLGLIPGAEPIDLGVLLAPDAPADVVAELRSIYAVVDELPADERVALLLRRVEGVPLEEVARLCNCSTATAKRRIAAAEQRLRRAGAAGDSPASAKGGKKRVA